jgi:hypothetical protein
MSYPLDDSFWVYRYIQARAQPEIDADLYLCIP